MWVAVAIGLLACTVVVFTYAAGYESGGAARALEDKNALVDAAIAQARAEQEVEQYRKQARVLLTWNEADKEQT